MLFPSPMAFWYRQDFTIFSIMGTRTWKFGTLAGFLDHIDESVLREEFIYMKTTFPLYAKAEARERNDLSFVWRCQNPLYFCQHLFCIRLPGLNIFNVLSLCPRCWFFMKDNCTCIETYLDFLLSQFWELFVTLTYLEFQQSVAVGSKVLTILYEWR